jgi:arsenate reductase-like glutaredoxin family protein
MGCKKAQGFLEKHALQVVDQVNAATARLGPEEALKLVKASHRVVIAKGKKVVTLDIRRDSPDDRTLLTYLLGPTGKLRAPTLRVGDTLLIGFNQEAYERVLQ